MKNYIENYIQTSIETKNKILHSEETLALIEKAAKIIIDAYRNGNKILTAGNGGSAGDAQHISAEFVSKFFKERPALSAITLTANTSILTSVGNDYDHKHVFARQLQAHGRKGDVFIAISTSGNSKNIVQAVREAQNLDIKVIGLTGSRPCEMDGLCDCQIKVPSETTSIIQESHIMIEHIICALVEKELF